MDRFTCRFDILKQKQAVLKYIFIVVWSISQVSINPIV